MSWGCRKVRRRVEVKIDSHHGPYDQMSLCDKILLGVCNCSLGAARPRRLLLQRCWIRLCSTDFHLREGIEIPCAAYVAIHKIRFIEIQFLVRIRGFEAIRLGILLLLVLTRILSWRWWFSHVASFNTTGLPLIKDCSSNWKSWCRCRYSIDQVTQGLACVLESSSATCRRAANLDPLTVSEIVLVLALSVFFPLGNNPADFSPVRTHLASCSLTDP